MKYEPLVITAMILILLIGYLILTKYLRTTPETFVVAATIFSILWVIAIVIVYHAIHSGPRPGPRQT